jgi:excisionase family DNA binding protein
MTPTPPGAPDVSQDGMNLKQVAGRLGVHYMTAYRYVRQGRMAATRVGTEWRVTEAAVATFVAGKAPGADPGALSVDWAGRLVPSLLAGDEPSAWRVVADALASGHPPTFCYVDMLSPALVTIGAEWEAGEVTVADQHIATAVASRLVARLGALTRRPGRSRGTVVFGAPLGELHSLPIAIAADLVRLAGFNVLELGADVPPEAFALSSQRAPRLVAIGIGVTGREQLPAAQEAIDAIRAVAPVVPILIGGQAAISTAGAVLTGVSAWAPDGPAAVEQIEEFSRRRRPTRVPNP